MNFGGKRRKILFFIIDILAYLPIGLLKVQMQTLVGCGIKFYIKRLPIMHTS